MNHQLRPLNLGETLDRTFQIYRSNFSLFTGIALAGALFNLIWSTLQMIALRNAMNAGIRSSSFQIVNGLGSYAVLFISLIAESIVWAAMVLAVGRIYRGQPVDATGALRAVTPHWFRLAIVTMMAMVIAWGLPAIAAGSMFVILAKHANRQNAGAMIAMGGIGLSFVATIPLGIWLSLRFSLVNAIAAFEGTRLPASLRRSSVLTNGVKGRVFVLLLVVLVLDIVLGLILAIPNWASLAHGLRNHYHMPLWASIYGLASGVVLHTLVTPVFGIGLALFYFDARARKEGLDVEWNLDAAPAAGTASFADNADISPSTLG